MEASKKSLSENRAHISGSLKSIVPVVTEYHALEFYDKKKGRKVHSAFPGGVTDDVNYDESMKAMLFLLYSRCNVSLEKTAQFVKDVTDGALLPDD